MMSSQDEAGAIECVHLLFEEKDEENEVAEDNNRLNEAAGGVPFAVTETNDTNTTSVDEGGMKTDAVHSTISPTTTEVNKPNTVTENLVEEKTIDQPVGDIPAGLYQELLDLETLALLPNAEPFQCAVCTEDCEAGAGVVIRDCAHYFCRECLSAAVRHCSETIVPCPATGCTGSLEEREIRYLSTPEEYESWLARGLAAVERSSRLAFHCRMTNCKGWAFCESAVQNFLCPVCHYVTCIPCQAIHEGETCQDHQLREIDQDPTQRQSRVLLDNWIGGGIAMKCPQCGITIVKTSGCDGMTCSSCKTKICWATRGPRWGPGGNGDISGGCRCKVNGRLCHPSCSNCH